jgi:hypothetical protein
LSNKKPRLRASVDGGISADPIQIGLKLDDDDLDIGMNTVLLQFNLRKWWCIQFIIIL